MKSRLTLIAILALGLLMCGSGASLAASGSAGSAQYSPEEESHFCEENGGVEGAGGCEYPCVEEDGSTGEVGESSPGQPCEHQEAQAEQSESQESETPAPAPAPPESGTGSGSLPYTGFPTVPVLIVGLGLLGGGVAMRMRLRSSNRFV
jgi:hypothetical protein